MVFQLRTGPSFVVLVSSTALMALLLLPSAGSEGLPEVEFLSDGGLIWGTHKVEVSVTGDLAEGEVYYYVDEGPEIKMADPHSGRYEALIEVNELAEGPHTIYVVAYNSTGEKVTVSQDVDVDYNSPQVQVTSSGGDVSGDLLVTGTAVDPYLNESAVYCVVDDDLESSRGNVMTQVDDHFEFTLDTTQYEDGPHDLRIWAYDLWGSHNKSNGIGIGVDNTAPVVTITSAGGAVSAGYTIQATIEDDHFLDNQVWVVIDGDEANASDNPMGFAEGRWEALIDTALLEDGEHQLSVMATDALGNTNVSAPIEVEVDNTPPGIELLSEAGTQSGTYTVRVRITDPDVESVTVSMGGGTPQAMTQSGDEWSLDIDTTTMDDGETQVQIDAVDALGNPTYYSYRVILANRPDLEIINVAWDRSSITVGNTLGVTVTVKNNGSSEASGFKVAIMDGTDIVASTTVTEPLAVGMNEDYEVNWKTDKTGDHRLSIQVDPEDEVDESDEDDNAWPLHSDVRVKEKDSPGPGAALVLLGLLVAGALARRRRA